MMAWWLATTAMAGPLGTVTVLDNDVVEGRLALPASVEQVRAKLGTVASASRLSPQIRSVELRDSGSCDVFDVWMRTGFTPIGATVQWCATASGFEQTLVHSSMLSRWHATLDVLPHPAGSELVYRVDVGLAVPAPRAMVLRRSADALRAELAAIETAVR